MTIRSAGFGALPSGNRSGRADDHVHREGGVGVGQHGALRGPGRARRVDQRHHVARLGGSHAPLDLTGLLGPMATAELEEVVPREQAGVVVGVHPAGLDVDDRARPAGAHGQHLVDLLLVLGEVDLGRGVGEEVLDLGGGVGRVQPDGDAAHGDGGEVEQDPLRSVLGVDRHPVAGVYTEREQSVGGVEHKVPRAVPRVLLPDAERLLPHGDVVRRALGPAASHRRDRRRRRRRCTGRRVASHRYRHGVDSPYVGQAPITRQRSRGTLVASDDQPGKCLRLTTTFRSSPSDPLRRTTLSCACSRTAPGCRGRPP